MTTAPLLMKTLPVMMKLTGWLIHAPRPPLRKVLPVMVTSVQLFSTLTIRLPLLPSTRLPVMVAFWQNSAKKNAPMRLPRMWLFAKTMFRQRWMCIVSPIALSWQPVTRTLRAPTMSKAPFPGPPPVGA